MKVLLAIPVYTAVLDVRFVISLVNTMRLHGAMLTGFDKPERLELVIQYIYGDALVQRARNELMESALRQRVDSIVFIDSDIVWKLDDFIALIKHREPFVGGLYRKKKTDRQEFVVSCPEGQLKMYDNHTLQEVSGIGFGFLKMDLCVLEALAKDCATYTNDEGILTHEFATVGVALRPDQTVPVFRGEDICLCDRWRALGNKVYLDTTLCLTHLGSYEYKIDLSPEGLESSRQAAEEANEKERARMRALVAQPQK
jgi:hypothetical protein